MKFTRLAFLFAFFAVAQFVAGGIVGAPCNYQTNGDSQCNPSAGVYCVEYSCQTVSDTSTYCNDPDGSNIYVKGTVNFRYRDYAGRFMSGSLLDECLSGYQFVTSCTGSNCNVREVVCIPQYSFPYSFQTVSCSNGCSKGACLQPAPTPGANCTNGIKDYDENGVDCGGAYCTPCQPTQPTQPPAQPGANCTNGIKDYDESGIDCGGAYCQPCEHCHDSMRNYDETDTDCGGLSCNKCRDGRRCSTDDGCISNYCNPSKKCSTPSCMDNIQNQGETGIDCGGDFCAPCGTCSDGIKKRGEEGIDCGGPCPTCIIEEEPQLPDRISNQELLRYIAQWNQRIINDARMLQLVEIWKRS